MINRQLPRPDLGISALYTRPCRAVDFVKVKVYKYDIPVPWILNLREQVRGCFSIEVLKLEVMQTYSGEEQNLFDRKFIVRAVDTAPLDLFPVPSRLNYDSKVYPYKEVRLCDLISCNNPS